MSFKVHTALAASASMLRSEVRLDVLGASNIGALILRTGFGVSYTLTTIRNCNGLGCYITARSKPQDQHELRDGCDFSVSSDVFAIPRQKCRSRFEKRRIECMVTCCTRHYHLAEFASVMSHTCFFDIGTLSPVAFLVAHLRKYSNPELLKPSTLDPETWKILLSALRRAGAIEYPYALAP